MSSRARRGFATVLLVTGALAPLAAQTVPTVDLKTRDARSKYTLQRIGTLQELPDGRVVAADTKDRAFRMIDFAKGEVSLLGAQGDTASGYRTASAVFVNPEGGVLLWDAASRRFLKVSPSGQVGELVRLAPALGMAKGRSPGAVAGMDAMGAVYFTSDSAESKTIEMGGATRTMTMAIPSTESPIHRMTLGGTAEMEVGKITTRHADQMNQNGLVPYPFRDAWAVRSDGVMARVRADSYEVIWSKDGKETGRTGLLPYDPIKLTDVEQKAYKDSVIDMMSSALKGGSPGGDGRTTVDGGGGRGGPPVDLAGGGGGAPRVMVMGGGAGMAAGGGGQTMTFGGPPGGAAAPGGPPAFNPANIPFAPFPAVKPAIVTTGSAALFDANGNLWVARERAHGDPMPRYDIVAEGKGVIAHVTLPAKTRLVGLGKNGVYVARLEGEEEFLERYPLPKM